MSLAPIVTALLDGPHRAAGAVVSCSIPVSERVLNELASGSRGKVFDVRVSSGNRLTASARGPLGISLPVDVTIVSVDPHLNLTVQFNGLSGMLMSLLGSWLPHATRDSAGRFRFALADLPPLVPHRASLRHVQSVSLTTRPGVLHVHLVVAIR
jgi:hypothetical protein